MFSVPSVVNFVSDSVRLSLTYKNYFAESSRILQSSATMRVVMVTPRFDCDDAASDKLQSSSPELRSRKDPIARNLLDASQNGRADDQPFDRNSNRTQKL